MSFTRTYDTAVTCVGEAAKLMRAASIAASDLTECTLIKLSRARRCRKMRMQRMPSENLADDLVHDMRVLTHAVATSRNISTGVEIILEHSAAVRRAAIASSLSDPSSLITVDDTIASASEKFCRGCSRYAPLLQRAPSSANFPEHNERRDENVHELATTLRIGELIMYNSADTHYLAEEMRIIGLLSANLGKRLVSFTHECETAIHGQDDAESSTHTLVPNFCCRASELMARSVPALEIETHATQAFWIAIHKHFRNVEVTNATRPGYTWLGRFWERAMRTPRYKAMVRARDLLEQARAAKVRAQEALESLSNEMRDITGEPRWSLSEVFSVL
ncbi:hypothetical protein SEPCBS119000_003165 [Sporothrix epigloea]|uniref:Uncharacterized protein n=1 Tax=Sporothrix epigloea TaxID=1892477 RepID=A0ABP0DKC8_9PEZI